MKHSIGQQKQQSATLLRTSDSLDTLTTTATGSQHTGQFKMIIKMLQSILNCLVYCFFFLVQVSAEIVEVEYETNSDAESGEETLKLTARGHLRPESARSPRGDQTRPSSRDETKKEIQEDDEATLRELLIRYWRFFYRRYF